MNYKKIFVIVTLGLSFSSKSSYRKTYDFYNFRHKYKKRAHEYRECSKTYYYMEDPANTYCKTQATKIKKTLKDMGQKNFTAGAYEQDQYEKMCEEAQILLRPSARVNDLHKALLQPLTATILAGGPLSALYFLGRMIRQVIN